MPLELSNARVELSRRDELRAGGVIQAAGRQVHVLGRPGWRVDYQRLDYDDDPVAVERALEEALAAWLNDPARLPEAGVPVGRLPAPGVPRRGPGAGAHLRRAGQHGVLVGPGWPPDHQRLLARLWPRAAICWTRRAYDPEQLAWFSRKKTCAPGRTYLKGLGRLRRGHPLPGGGRGPDSHGGGVPQPALRAVFHLGRPLRHGGPPPGLRPLHPVLLHGH